VVILALVVDAMCVAHIAGIAWPRKREG